ALSRILSLDSSDSLLRRCYHENIGSRLFSDSCRELIDQLQQKTGLMTVESDIQIQAERIDPLLRKSKNQERLGMLAKLNLVSTQASDAIKTLRASYPESQYQDHLNEILPAVEKIRIAYESYLKAAGP
ncbi:MAG: hypothetical protein EBX52_02515, partial [Proteobacteria bacterium]|nr:hypothetical protein [Pseudomonadota bacterium]